MSPPETRTPRLALLAMFATAGMILILQIAMTRVLSSTLMYHFAFFVIAVVMLGMAASAARVFVHVARDGAVDLRRCARYLEIAAGLLAVAGVTYPHLGALGWDGLALGGQLGAMMLLFTPVFYLAGYVVASLLTEFKSDIGRIYWFDLLGAAIGCLVVVPLLGLVTALDVVVQCGALSLLGAFALHRINGAPKSRWAACLVGMVVLSFLTPAFGSLTKIRYAKGQPQDEVEWERWNHLARVTVSTDMPGSRRNLERLKKQGTEAQARQVVDRWSAGWGLSNKFDGAGPEIRWIALDSGAGTQIIKDGARDPSKLEFLSWDITSAGHHLQPGGLEEVFVIGGGGGRDILTALHMGAKHVDVVELNPLVVHSVEEAYGDFSGGPYSHPSVNTTVGEARGVLSRTDKRYDLIQMSMIDTWAATMAGSLALVENVLYTREAFALFVSRLDEDGVLSVSRWFNPEYPGELMRTLLLMGDALRGMGVDNVEKHIAVLYTRGHLGTGVATCLLQRAEFTEAQLVDLHKMAAYREFDVIWPSDRKDIPGAIRGEPGAFGGPEFDDSVPTDDRPFFFNLHKPIMSWVVALKEGDRDKGSQPTAMVFIILFGTALASYWLVLRPLLEHNREQPDGSQLSLRENAWATMYFAGLGLGFMGVELGLIQRTIVFLGHPTYSLSVVLFTLLLLTGVGSALSTRWDSGRSIAGIVGGILLGLAFLVIGAPPLFEALHDTSIAVRIATTVACVAPLALLMGMLLPTGMARLVDAGKPELVPWMWAVNGVFGVMSTVLAMFVATSFGYTVLIAAAAVAYIGVLIAATRPRSW